MAQTTIYQSCRGEAIAFLVFTNTTLRQLENFNLKNFVIFLIFAQNIDCGYTLEPPRRGGSNEYPQSMFWSKNKKKGIPLHTPILPYKSGV